MEVKVDTAAVDEAPLVLRFPAGCPDEEHKGSTDVQREAEGVAVTRRESRFPVSFVGAAKRDSRRNPCRYALGVYRAQLGSLTLIPLAGDGVVRMEPRVVGLPYAPCGTAVEVEGRRGVGQAALAFGDAKTKKRLRRAELNRPALQSAEEGDVMDVLVESITAQAKRDGLTREQVLEKSSRESRVLPPHCGEGRSIEEAFPFDQLCHSIYQSYLEVDQFLAAIDSERAEMEMRKAGESVFVMMQLKELKSENDAQERRRKVLRLSFLNVLMKIVSLSGRIRRCGSQKKLEEMTGERNIDPSLLQHILSLFFETRESGRNVRYDLPEAKQKLLWLYIFVLALMVTDSEMDAETVEQLRAELKIGRKKMTECFESLGAKFTRQGKLGPTGVRLLTDGKTLDEILPIIKQTKRQRLNR